MPRPLALLLLQWQFLIRVADGSRDSILDSVEAALAPDGAALPSAAISSATPTTAGKNRTEAVVRQRSVSALISARNREEKTANAWEPIAANASSPTAVVNKTGNVSTGRPDAAKAPEQEAGQSFVHGAAAFTALLQSSVSSQLEVAHRHVAQLASRSNLSTGTKLGMGNAMKMAGACFIFVVIYKFLTSIDCASRRLDPRRCKCIARKLLEWGWDEFETFGVRVTVHGLQDIQQGGMMGKKKYQVTVGFKWSKFVTAPTNDLRWEQTKGMDVPQGASECEITLSSMGSIKNTTVATVSLETKFHMIDKQKFWGTKQKLKMEHNGKHVGTLLVTFRLKGDGEESDVPIEGVDEDSSLAMELVKEFEDLVESPGFVKPEGKLEGWDKIALLTKVLEGNLRVVDSKGKEQETCYVKARLCNFAELQGDNMNEELKKQQKKAASKGLTELERKCYWVWYENKAHANDEKRWHYPDGFLPMASISSVHRSPERADQFILKYCSEGDKDVLIYRREGGKGLDTWVDGIDLCVSTCRDVVKQKKREAEKQEAALQRMRVMHQMFVQQNGFPQDEKQWRVWHDYLEDNNYDENYIQVLYHEVMPHA